MISISLLLLLLPPLSSSAMFFHPLLKEDEQHAHTRKPWYQRTMEAMNLWRSATKTGGDLGNSDKAKLRKCRSLRVAISFTRVCLCAPISSYNEAFWADIPRRSSSSSVLRSRSFAQHQDGISRSRSSAEGRRIFRGKSLTDDVMMRRFVVEEAGMKVRRINQMEFVRRKNSVRKRNLGPSPLGRMAMARKEEEEEEEFSVRLI